MNFRQRDLGKFLPIAHAIRRERMQQKMLEERQVLWRKAINEALMDSKVREPLQRKMYRGEPFTLADWPTLQPLIAQERTEIIREVRRIFRIPDRKPE